MRHQKAMAVLVEQHLDLHFVFKSGLRKLFLHETGDEI